MTTQLKRRRMIKLKASLLSFLSKKRIVGRVGWSFTYGTVLASKVTNEWAGRHVRPLKISAEPHVRAHCGPV